MGMAPRGKRKIAIQPQRQRQLKNPRIERHCAKCGTTTAHTVIPSGGNHCVICINNRQALYRKNNANLPAVKTCNAHSMNTHRCPMGSHCGCCYQAGQLVRDMRKGDASAGRVCTDASGPVTVEFMNSLEGMQCNVCGDPCYMLYDPMVAYNPWCMSLGRVGRGMSHDCNLEHNRPQHLICNLTIYTMTIDELLFRIKCAGENDCSIDMSLPDAKFPAHATANGRPFATQLIAYKKFRDLRLEWLIITYEVTQKGCCVGCTAPMGTDISFDRIDSTKDYVESNVQLMHRSCNGGKGQDPLDVLHTMFRKAYAYHFLNTSDRSCV